MFSHFSKRKFISSTSMKNMIRKTRKEIYLKLVSSPRSCKKAGEEKLNRAPEISYKNIKYTFPKENER